MDLPIVAVSGSDGGPMADELSDLYRAHARSLVGFATMLVGRDDAPDVVSSAFARALTASGWPTVQHPRRYLQRIVANEAYNMRRGRGRRERRELRDHLMRDFTSMPVDESSLEVRRSVALLSTRQRAVVFLAYWEDLTEADIADTLGISVGSVSRHMARARAHLRRTLDD